MKVVILTGDKYPCGDAGALREHAIAKVLQNLGHEVLVLGYGEYTGKKMMSYDGISYVSFKPKSSNLLIRALFRFFDIFRMKHYISRNCERVDALLVVDFAPRAFKVIRMLQKKYNSILIHDSVEWYSPEEFEQGEKSVAYRNKEYTNTVAIGRGWRVIAISKFLEKHFEKKCDKVVRIPVIMDVSAIECNLQPPSSEKIIISYVGSPGRKDYLNEVLLGASMLSDEHLEKLEINVVGVNREQLKSICGVEEQTLTRLGDSLKIHGRLPHDNAIGFVRNADFTVLCRDSSLRYAKAGFPTKIVESLSCGTPPICNLSSDLELYLKDGENAVISEGFDSLQIKEALIKALLLSPSDRERMRKNARDTAERSFDRCVYTETIKKLLE